MIRLIEVVPPRIFIFLLYCWIGLTVISCSDNARNPTGSMPKGSIFPLADGNYWEYTFPESIYNNTQLIVYHLVQGLLPNKQWYFSGRGTIVQERSDGIWWARTNGSESGVTLSDSELLYKYPANTGDTWSILSATSLDGSRIYSAMKVVAVNEPINVPASTFPCIVYECSYEEFPLSVWTAMRHYFAPNIGLVRVDYKYRDTGKWKITKVLTSYFVQ
jgi:hypothetical protein